MKTLVNIKSNRCMLKRSGKKNGFDLWRFYVNGINSVTGENKAFFFDYYILNPGLSPEEPVLGFKTRLKKSAADLQYALTGNGNGEAAELEKFVTPSFIMIRAGIVDSNGKTVSGYYSSNQLVTQKHGELFTAGSENRRCIITENQIKGIVCVTNATVQEKTELLCDAGMIEWNLHYELKKSFYPEYKSKISSWSAIGAYTVFSGIIRIDGAEYKVSPEKSYGYIDKNWGKDFQAPFFHLSSSNLNSLISGRKLENSIFVVNGVYNGELSVFAVIDGRIVEFPACKNNKSSLSFDCNEMPQEEDSVKLHWTVSVHGRKNVLDIDVFCKTEKALVRDFESPAGKRKILKLLGSGAGSGELRLYKRSRKNLEILEHVTVENAVCEYGDFESPESQKEQEQAF